MCSISSLFFRTLPAAKSRWFCLTVFLCAPLLGLPAPAAAQEATIVGTVTDQSGAAIPGVTIFLPMYKPGPFVPRYQTRSASMWRLVCLLASTI